MSFSFWKNTNNRVILLISLVFILLVSSEHLFLYNQLERIFYSQVEDLTNSSFHLFGRSLDRIFYNTEVTSKKYKNKLIRCLPAEDLKHTLDTMTEAFLESNPRIVEIGVLLQPNTTTPDYSSRCAFDASKRAYKITPLHSSAKAAMAELVQTYADSAELSMFWTPLYQSADAKDSSLITTLVLPIADTAASGKLLGVVTISLQLSTFENLISFFSLGDRSQNMLLDDKGKILLSPLPQFRRQGIDTTLNPNNNFVAAYKRYQEAKQNAYFEMAKTNMIDSIGSFKCPNSMALSYRLHNGWQMITMFYNQPFLFSLQPFNPILLSISIFIFVLFFIIITYIINKALSDINIITDSIINWNKYDIHEWKLPILDSKSSFSLFVNSFNELHDNYRHTQNKLSDSLMQNEKLMHNELKVESRIKQAVEEETVKLTSRNKMLDMAFENLTELNELGRIISGSLNIDDIAQAIYNRLVQLVPINFFGVLVFDKNSNTLICRTGVLNGEFVPPFTIYVAEKNNIAGRCVEKNEPIAINNFELEYANYLLVNHYNPLTINMSSQYFAPLTDNDNILGVFTIQSIYKGIFKDFNLDILSILNTYLNIAIRNIISFEELQTSIKKLNQAQTKLILSEKMASIGQLAAGISHEIKNPLNFVINFSELTNLLATDIKDSLKEFKSDNTQDKDKAFANIEDMVGNMQMNISKIAEHSMRADKIVKGMLQLSRGKTGEFILTNINDLITEYTKLAYHGLRATDPLFHVELSYNLDNNLGKVSVVSHDISRVIINVVGNACMATFQKHQANPTSSSKPEVKVSTQDMGNHFAIIVHDNGIGIPEENQSKVFNPFFTTKSAGEGTGLGLAISYDIVVAEHSGEITFDTKENEFTEFRIILPKNTN